MAVPADTFETFDTKGIREDLADIIYRIEREDVPFTNNIGRASVSGTKHEWQTQALAAANGDNKVPEGDDATTDAATPTVRPGNWIQLSDKVAQVSSKNEAVDAAGRGSEMAYQLLLKGLELRRDVEARLVGNYASTPGSSGTAAEAGGFEAWLVTNTNRDATSGANGGYNVGTGNVVAATDSSAQRAFDESQLQAVMQSIYTSGGGMNDRMLMTGPFNKVAASAFAGIAETRIPQTRDTMTTIIGAADVYVSDFGNLNMVPNAHQRERTALFIDPRFVKMATLVPMRTEELAKTGHSDREMISIQYTLRVDNERAHGCVADLNTA